MLHKNAMNTLSVNLQHSIATSAAGKRSQRDIAKLLGILQTVRRQENVRQFKVGIGTHNLRDAVFTFGSKDFLGMAIYNHALLSPY
jgi:hypothetical protein